MAVFSGGLACPYAVGIIGGGAFLMSSPFPGMNPYLENPAVWHDFHGVFVTLMRLDLARQLRGRYQVRMDENIYVHELDAEQRRLLGRADAHVASPGSERVESTMAVTLTAPVQGTLPVGVDLLRERFIEIRDGQDQRVIEPDQQAARP